ncbi:MAG: arylsulfatase [Verrucomicrobiales bacterium]|nr:arylsulfatase [Verrucomicrobiales bacterium]
MKKLITLLFALATSALAQETKPNIVLIFADDLGYGDLGCYGATKVQTPNIDRLASEGRRFTDAHSASAVCTPSRYALLTGEYPVRKNLYVPVFLKTGLVVDTNKQTVASLLRKSGYATACIGKWHLGFGKGRPDWNGDLKPGPLELGFDYYFGVPVVNSHPPFVYVENHRVVGHVPEDPFVYDKKAKTREFFEKMGYSQIGGADAAHALYDDEMVGTKLTEKSIEWIKTQEKPFFLYLSTTNIHHPFTPHPRFKGTSQCGPYGDYIHELDWIVGEVMAALDEMEVADNTLVIFTSDNGGMFNVGGQNAWEAGHEMNGELFGFKFDAWEGGHRVPFIARWPGKIEAGTESDQLISNVDLLATSAAITGEKIEDGQGRDSVNALSALTENPEEPIREHLLLAAKDRSHLSIRKGKWMFIDAQAGGGFTAAKRGAHAFGGPKAITFVGRENSDIADGKIKPGAPPAQLYDLESDLEQTTNLYEQHPEVVKELRTLLDSYRAAGPNPKKPSSKKKAP